MSFPTVFYVYIFTKLNNHENVVQEQECVGSYVSACFIDCKEH